jgi:hypothetical protein
MISKRTQGEIAPSEFRIPSETTKLMKSDTFQAWRFGVHCFYAKYVKPRQYILAQVAKVCEAFSEHMIAVHFRHPSHCCEQGAIYLQEYFDLIDKHTKHNTKIYLATDTEFGVAAFKHKYGDRIVYNTAISRTSIDNILEWAFARGNAKTDNVGFVGNKGYELHHENAGMSGTKLGEDVICDVLTICRCNVFIHSLSNIALAVSYINPHIEMVMVG